MKHCSSLWLRIALLSFVAACKQPKEHVLPFYIGPDLTPLWISEQSDSFKHIHTIPPFSFLNQNGDTVTEKTVAGKIYVANFVFTSCTSICPRMFKNFAVLQHQFAGDDEVMFLSHTVDPDRDSVGKLRQYALTKNIKAPQWELLTGNKTDIYTLAKKSYFAGDSLGYYGDIGEFLHTEKVLLIDKKRRIRGVYNGTLQVEMDRIAEDIKTLEQEDEDNEVWAQLPGALKH